MAPSTTSVFIRAARRPDYHRLGPVFDEAEVFHRKSLPAVFREPPGRFPSRRFFDEVVASDHAALFVADAGEDLVGYTAVRAGRTPDEEIPIPGAFAVVDLLAVRSDRRRQGIGRALMAAAHEWAQNRQLARITLSVWDFNLDAIAFYESLGFSTLSRVMERTA